MRHKGGAWLEVRMMVSRGVALVVALWAAGCSKGPAAPAGEAPMAAGEGAAKGGGVVLLGGLGERDEARVEAERFGARAQAGVGSLKTDLMGALQAALGEGVEAALGVCNVEAPRLATAASAVAGLDVGRVSHKPRNPGNAVQPWMTPVVAHFTGSTAASPAAPVVVRRPEGGLAYFEPIYTGGLCLACHGESIAPAVQGRIAALYPGDRAVGFKAGELRGLFRAWPAVE